MALAQPVREQADARQTVDVDEPGRDDLSARIDDGRRGAVAEVTDRGYPIPSHADIGCDGVGARAVDDLASANDDGEVRFAGAPGREDNENQQRQLVSGGARA